MRLSRLAIVGGLLTSGVASVQAAWYYTEASFLSALSSYASSSFHLEDFNSITSYGILPLTFSSSGNGFSWTASTTGNLYGIIPGGDGALSTFTDDVPLNWTFSGNQVTAFGGRFFNSDDPGNNIGGQVTLNLNGNAISSGVQTATFLGWVDTQAITGASVTGAGVGNFISADHVYAANAANAVPEPFTMGLGLAAAATFVRRRVKK